MIELIIKHSNTITVIGGGLATLVMLFVNLRKFISPKWSIFVKNLKAKHDVPRLVQEIVNTLKDIDSRVKKVEYEITPNSGSSMKDAMRIIRAEIEAANWLHPKPSFRTTSFGINIFVNEAYCNLCGVSSNELMKLGWKNFILDPKEGDDFMRRWLESSKEFSQFSGNLKFKNIHDKYVGEWVCKLRPLGPLESDTTNYLWHGTLSPHDEVALEYSTMYNIPH
jgi:PAS domain-containing protein